MAQSAGDQLITIGELNSDVKYIVKAVDGLKTDLSDGLEKVHGRISEAKEENKEIEHRLTVTEGEVKTITNTCAVVQQNKRKIYGSLVVWAVITLAAFLYIVAMHIGYHVPEAQGGVKSAVSKPFVKAWDGITSPMGCKVGFYAFWLFGRGFCDSLVDAHRWERIGDPTGETKIINDQNWHIIKNARDFSTIIAGMFLGGAYAAGYVDFWQAVRRGIYGSAITYPTWRNTYTYSRWGDWWDTSAAHNEHILPYPGPDLKDRYVSMKGGQVTVFYMALYTVGFTGMLTEIRLQEAIMYGFSGEGLIQWAIEHWFLTATGAGAVISTITKLYPTDKLQEQTEALKKKLTPVCYNAGRLLTIGGNTKLRGFYEPIEQFFIDGLEVFVRVGSDIFDTCYRAFIAGLRSDNKPKEEKKS